MLPCYLDILCNGWSSLDLARQCWESSLISMENRHTWNCPKFLVWIIFCMPDFSTHSCFSWNPAGLCNGNCMWHVFHTHGLIKVKLTISLFSVSDFARQPVVSLGCFLTDDCFCFPWEQRCFVTLIKCLSVLGSSAAQNTPKSVWNWHKKLWKGKRELEARPRTMKSLVTKLGKCHKFSSVDRLKMVDKDEFTWIFFKLQLYAAFVAFQSFRFFFLSI